jgi:VanZ family protein
MARRPRTIIPVAAVAALVLASLVGPPAAVPAALFPVFHLVGYAALAAALRPWLAPGRRGTAVAALVAAGVGAGVELLQLGVAARTFSTADLAVNAVGAVAGAVLAARWRRD